MRYPQTPEKKGFLFRRRKNVSVRQILFPQGAWGEVRVSESLVGARTCIRLELRTVAADPLVAVPPASDSDSIDRPQPRMSNSIVC